MTQNNTQATKEQVLYADVLEKGMYAGLLLMVITFALYVLRVIPPIVPRSEISTYWSMPVHDYLVAINTNFLHWETLPTGWSWVKLLGYGDFLNFMPIAILSGVTIVCYSIIAPGLFARGDKAMGIMAIAEVLILSLAASGLLSVGH
ncbi:MAG: hypothetical protein FP813_08860 [Desulfurivibrio sp.]|nr:hypothetical protein [Desulfurivibrio sp.]MBU4117433.1 hypothetical protein [Pseudomonadota bacterium]